MPRSLTKPPWYDVERRLVPPGRAGLEASILDAARRSYLRYGPVKARMVDVARVAGASRASVYNYLGDHDSMLRAVRVWAVDAFIDDVRVAMAGEADIWNQLAAATIVVLRYEKWRHLPGQTLDIGLELESFTTASSSTVSKLTAVMQYFLEAEVRHGAIRSHADVPSVAEWFARILFSLFTTPGVVFDSRRPADVVRFISDTAKSLLGL